MAIDFTQYFNIFRSWAEVIQTLNISRATTVPTVIDSAITEVKTLDDTVDHQAITDQLLAGVRGWQTNEALTTTDQQIAQAVLVQMINDDDTQPNLSVRTALLAMIQNMLDDSQTVKACVPTISVTVPLSNVAEVVLAATIYGSDGQPLQNSIPDTIIGTMQGGSILLQGTPSQPNPLAYNWPLGTGVSQTITPDPSAGILLNGGMDTDANETNVPDSWLPIVGVPGSTLLMSTYQEYDIVIAGTPVTGIWRLGATLGTNVVETAPIAIGANAAAVQSALRQLPGFGSVTVTLSSGTTPNFTYHLILNNVLPPGNLAAFSYNDTFNTGSITLTQTHAVSGGLAYRNRSVSFVADGSELTELRQLVNLSPSTVYVFNGYFSVNSFPAAGELTVELVDGAGSAMPGGHSYVNSFTIDLTSVGPLTAGAFEPITFWFITPEDLPSIIYLDIRLSTALSIIHGLSIDQLNLSAATQLYSGGPFIAALLGRGTTVLSDTWQIDAVNDFAGKIQSYNTRLFQQYDLLLPSALMGWTIPDGSLS